MWADEESGFWRKHSISETTSLTSRWCVTVKLLEPYIRSRISSEQSCFTSQGNTASIDSDNIRFVTVIDSVIQRSLQQNFADHVVQSMITVHDSLICHGNGTTSSIHHDYSQHVKVQHKRLPLELIKLKTRVQFMKNSNINWMYSPSLTFFTSAAADLLNCKEDESMCVFSLKRVDHPRKSAWSSSTCKRDIMNLTVSRSKDRCSCWLLSRRWVSSWMTGYYVDIAGANKWLLLSAVIKQHINDWICSEECTFMVSFRLSCGVAVCTTTFLSPVFDDDDHEDIVESTANLTNVDVNRQSTMILKTDFYEQSYSTDIKRFFHCENVL